MRVRNWLSSIINAIRILRSRRQRRWLSHLLATRHRHLRCVLAAAALTPLLAASSNGDETLFPFQDTYAVGNFPTGTTTGDFNGDGVADLATANLSSTNVSVLLGVGNGTFAAQPTYTAGSSPIAVTTGDLNGDGVADLATANIGGSVGVLLGKGNGSFAAPISFPTESGTFSITTGDFNGDGATDHVTANAYSDNVSILLGGGERNIRGPGYLRGRRQSIVRNFGRL